MFQNQASYNFSHLKPLVWLADFQDKAIQAKNHIFCFSLTLPRFFSQNSNSTKLSKISSPPSSHTPSSFGGLQDPCHERLCNARIPGILCRKFKRSRKSQAVMNHLIPTFRSVKSDYLALGKVAYLVSALQIEELLRVWKVFWKTTGKYWKHNYGKVE